MPSINKDYFHCKCIEKVCKKKAAGKNVWQHSSNTVTETQKAEDETEDSDLLSIYCLNHNHTPLIKSVSK